MSEECKKPCLIFRTPEDVLQDPLWTVATPWKDPLAERLGNFVKVWGSVPWLAGPDVTEGEIEVPGYPPFQFCTHHIDAEPASLYICMQCAFPHNERKPIRYLSSRILIEDHAVCTCRYLAFFLLLSYIADLLIERGTLDGF